MISDNLNDNMNLNGESKRIKLNSIITQNLMRNHNFNEKMTYVIINCLYHDTIFINLYLYCIFKSIIIYFFFFLYLSHL